MKIDLPLSSGITLKIDSDPTRGVPYPTSRIQKGLILLYEGQELCEEAVGFGVPILKRGLNTIFPGEVELLPRSGGFTRGVQARFNMNLVEKLSKTGSGTINNQGIYYGKNLLAAAIRALPFMRRSLTSISNLLRSWLNLETTFETANTSSYISLVYSVDPGAGKIVVELDNQDHFHPDITEIILMNEQGARYFDHYQDSDGISLHGDEIGCWDQVRSTEATFVDYKHQISFSLPRVDGAGLYRGRELIGKRLAWTGFGYSFPPNLSRYRYEITVKKF